MCQVSTIWQIKILAEEKFMLHTQTQTENNQEFHAVKLPQTTPLLKADEKLEQLVEEIKAAYAVQLESGGKTIASIVQVGRLCQKARKHIAKLGNELPRTTQLEMATGFSKGSISRYCKIADNRAIVDTKNHSRLPSSVFSLYELCVIPDLQDAIDSGEVTPDMGRDSIEKLVRISKGEEPETKLGTLTSVEAFTVSFPAKTWEKNHNALEPGLRKLLKDYDDATLTYGRPVQEIIIERLRKQAQQQYDKLRSKVPENGRELGTLVDNAIAECDKNGISVFIEETGKKGWQLSPDWKLLPHLREALDLKPNDPIYRSTIFKQARAKGVVCRLIPLTSLNREIDLWIALLNICNNKQRQALKKKLKEKSENSLRGAKAMPDAKRIKEIATQIYADVRYL